MIYYLLSIPCTIAVFLIARYLLSFKPNPFLNPMIISVIIIALIIYTFDLSYPQYFQASSLLNESMQLTLVSLGFVLNQHKQAIKKHWKLILVTATIASLTAVISGLAFAFIFGANQQIMATILPKSTTNPIALAITQNLHGIASLAAFCVVIAGLTGVVAGYWLFEKLKIQSHIAKGLAMGAASHVLGTVEAAGRNEADASFSSISFIICGIITSILAPVVFWLLY
jgi:predicted murein hydrolase (TIGR00659 family)